MLLVIGFDEPLQAALAKGAVTDDRRRYEPEAHHLAEPVGGELAPVQTRGEVPQGALPVARLVDRAADPFPVNGEVHQEGRIAAPRHAPFDVDLGALEQVEMGQFIRGHAWPSGSIGRPHHRHAGLPAATTSSA